MNQRKQQRIEEAKERQAAYDALTLEQKRDLCESRRGASRKELTRILTQLEAKQEAA